MDVDGEDVSLQLVLCLIVDLKKNKKGGVRIPKPV